MPHTLLNVVRHPGNKLRFGVINEEFLLALRAERIRITKLPGLVNDIVVNPTRAYYSNGSIFSNEINNWLSHYYPRTAADPIWLLKFEFMQNENEHVYEFIADSGYRKYSRKPILLTPQGEQVQAPRNSELCEFIWR